MRGFRLPTLLAAAALAVGCAGSAYYEPGYGYGYSAYTPELAYIAPGVGVVAGYHEPIFYNDGLYWRYSNNRWYRSNYWDRGWVYARPPRVIARIDQPYRYRYYRGPDRYYRGDRYISRGAPYRYDDRRTVPRTYQRGPVYRDQRQYQQQRPYQQRQYRGDQRAYRGDQRPYQQRQYQQRQYQQRQYQQRQYQQRQYQQQRPYQQRQYRGDQRQYQQRQYQQRQQRPYQPRTSGVRVIDRD